MFHSLSSSASLAVDFYFFATWCSSPIYAHHVTEAACLPFPDDAYQAALHPRSSYYCFVCCMFRVCTVFLAFFLGNHYSVALMTYRLLYCRLSTVKCESPNTDAGWRWAQQKLMTFPSTASCSYAASCPWRLAASPAETRVFSPAVFNAMLEQAVLEYKRTSSQVVRLPGFHFFRDLVNHSRCTRCVRWPVNDGPHPFLQPCHNTVGSRVRSFRTPPLLHNTFYGKTLVTLQRHLPRSCYSNLTLENTSKEVEKGQPP